MAFTATCPHCKRDRLQRGFTVADLMELLYAGDPIKAHCRFCGEAWIVGVQKRVELGEIVAAVCANPSPPAGNGIFD